MRHFIRAFFVLLPAFLNLPASAQSYLGATALLHRVEEETAKAASTNKTSDAQSQLRTDLKAFQHTVTNLPPDQAATNWLDLVDRALKIQKETPVDYNPRNLPLQPDDVLAALPPPYCVAGPCHCHRRASSGEGQR